MNANAVDWGGNAWHGVDAPPSCMTCGHELSVGHADDCPADELCASCGDPTAAVGGEGWNQVSGLHRACEERIADTDHYAYRGE